MRSETPSNEPNNEIWVNVTNYVERYITILKLANGERERERERERE